MCKKESDVDDMVYQAKKALTLERVKESIEKCSCREGKCKSPISLQTMNIREGECFGESNSRTTCKN